MRRQTIVLLLALAAFAACESTPDSVESACVEIRFPFEAAEEPIHAAGGSGGRTHWLEGGWGTPEENGMWLLGEGGTLCADLPARASRLIVDLQTREELAAAGQELRLLINGNGLATLLPPARDDSKPDSLDIPASWLDAEVDRLEFRCSMDLNSLGTAEEPRLAVFIKHLRIEQRGEIAARNEAGWWDTEHWSVSDLESVPSAPATADTPDILVLILDAARADHVGAYGYPRATTPFIDSLANDGIVLSDLHAVAPFTRCSMPSFLTGTPWFAHGMALNEDQLPDAIPTIAEFFAQAGYQPLALSESPHVSRASRLDRGFEQFWESWKHPDLERLAEEAGGDLLVAMFASMLAAYLDERPAFTLVHMIPPHIPYVPTAEFDLWTEDDPEREWRSVGPKGLAAIRRGKRVLSDAEKRRLVALYDGNLRRADDLVEKLVRHWHGLGRDRPLQILITSDHGEALGDHGFYGHNFSLFDEMTRIPGVLWPRAAFPELAARGEQLWSNEDLLPLLLRNIGWQPREDTLLPRPFLELLRDPDYERPVVLMRSLRNIGARSRDQLWIFDRRRGPQAYDLGADPACVRDLWPARDPRFPDWAGGLGRLLAESASTRPNQIEAISNPDEERLRALGYID